MMKTFARRLRQLLTRALVRLVDPATALQTLQAEGLAGELLDGLEHLEPYGFSAVPLPGAEALLASLGGRRAHTVVLVVPDRRHRPRDLAAGDVALYDHRGQAVRLTASGIVITAPLGLVIEGDLAVEGAAHITGALTAAEVSAAGGITLTTHRHTGVDTGSGTSGPPTP